MLEDGKAVDPLQEQYHEWKLKTVAETRWQNLPKLKPIGNAVSVSGSIPRYPGRHIPGLNVPFTAAAKSPRIHQCQIRWFFGIPKKRLGQRESDTSFGAGYLAPAPQ